MSASNPDGKFFVVRKTDGARVSGKLHETQELAAKEAASLTESNGLTTAAPQFEVKQIING